MPAGLVRVHLVTQWRTFHRHAPLPTLPAAPPNCHPTTPATRYKLNIWDVGGQKTLRPYWRNYYEKTDGLIWVVDSADLARLEDCRKELHALLQEERLFGATLLILANKQDIPSALSLEEIEMVCPAAVATRSQPVFSSRGREAGSRWPQHPQRWQHRACAGCSRVRWHVCRATVPGFA